MKQIREISDCVAKIILNRKGQHVATVQARYGSGGGVQVDVWSQKPGERWLSLTHQSKAGGYGYDKYTAALAGAVIDGHRMANHCGSGDAQHEKKKAALLKAYRKAARAGLTREETKVFEKKAERIGCRFANWCPSDFAPVTPDGRGYAWSSLHTVAGLERLSMLGYKIIDAL